MLKQLRLIKDLTHPLECDWARAEAHRHTDAQRSKNVLRRISDRESWHLNAHRLALGVTATRHSKKIFLAEVSILSDRSIPRLVALACEVSRLFPRISSMTGQHGLLLAHLRSDGRLSVGNDPVAR